MENRVLGKDLVVSSVGLGCMGFTHAYGKALDEDIAVKNIQAGYEMGYTFFDTAECYTGTYNDGTKAFNEMVVGKALKNVRHSVKIATKCGVTIAGDGKLIVNSSPESIRKSIESSLQKLQTDYIDLYYQHRIDPKVDPETVAEVMGDLIREGKILNWGISETDAEYLQRANTITPVTAIQNRFSMMARWYEDLFPVLEELGIGFVAFSPLANGFLTDAFKKGQTFEEGDYRNFMPQYKAKSYESNRELLELIRRLAEEKDATPAQISLAWVLAKRPYIVPIPGSRKLERMKSNIEAADIYLSDKDMVEIDGLLDRMNITDVFGGSAVKPN